MSEAFLPIARIARHRSSVLLVLVVASLLATAVPAAAGGPPPPVNSHSGNVGAHGLTDSEATPAATCLYGYYVGTDYRDYLYRIRVQPPVAYARQGKSSQRIAWRFEIQGWGGDAWVSLSVSSWVTRSATPTTAAAFSKQAMAVDAWAQSADYYQFRAKIDVRWYKADGTVAGKARLFPHWYLTREGSLADYLQTEMCGGTTG